MAARVHLTSVTVQHISKDVSLSGTISSAPRDFALFVSLCWAGNRAYPARTFPLCRDESELLSLCSSPEGLDADGEEETLLGTFTYTAKAPMQTFTLEVRSMHGDKKPGSEPALAARPWQEERDAFSLARGARTTAKRDMGGLGGLSSMRWWQQKESKGRVSPMGARVPRGPWLQPWPAAEPAADVAAPPTQRLCAVEKQGRLVEWRKPSGSSVPWPAGRLGSVRSPQHSMPLLSRCAPAGQQESQSRQSRQRQLGGVAPQPPCAEEPLPGHCQHTASSRRKGD